MHGDSTPPPPAPPLSRGAQRAVDLVTDRHQESTVTRIAELAIQKHAAETDQELNLHFICGEHQFLSDRIRGTLHHINFVARRKGDEAPALFFAEVNALVGDASDVTLCSRAAVAGPWRLLGLRVWRKRLVHPVGKEFNGRVGFTDEEEGSPLLPL